MSQWQLSKVQCLVLVEASVIMLFITTQSTNPLKSFIAVGLTTPIVHKREDFDQLSYYVTAERTHSIVQNREFTWKKGSFCHSLIVDTFHDSIPICGSEMGRRDQVKCHGNAYSNTVATCLYQNLAVKPQEIQTMLPTDRDWEKPLSKSINLLQVNSVDCDSPSMENLVRRTQSRDYQSKITHHLPTSEKLSPKACDVWINKTTFFHVSNANHIYFRFLDLYNVHKALLDYGAPENNHQVVRIGNLGGNYMFPQFDKALFPGALTLEDLQDNGTVCFKRVILVPRSYQAIPFRCKMNHLLKKHCFRCDAKGLTNSPLQTFRKRVLKACNIITEGTISDHPKIVIVSRKPYDRWPGDHTLNFKRVLVNEDEMVIKIQESFPNADMKILHMENISICEQVRYAAEADVILGVHGAGLVHFWWLRDEATGVELEPTFESSNPSFRMLTTLAGRKYVSETIVGNSSRVEVDVEHLVNELKQYLQKP